MTATQEQLDKLAKVVDPDSWKLYESENVVKTMDPKLREQIVKPSRDMAKRIEKSGLMASLEWDRAEYLRAMNSIVENTSCSGHCEDVPDLMDGYFRHDPKCPNWPDGAFGGSSCISLRRARS